MRITYDEIEIAYEDKKLIIADKPQGVPAQPDSSGDPDMVSLLEERRGILENKPGKGFVSAVNRLDRPTGGLMIFAKSSDAHTKIQAMINKHEIKKTYFCVVFGDVMPRTGRLESYIKDYPNGKRDLCTATEKDAEEAILEYKVLDVQKGLSLLEIDLITGRKHQIRIQMAKVLKHPIVGDYRYGQKENTKQNIPLHLWAVKLSLVHPYDIYHKILVISPPPVDQPIWEIFKIKERFLSITVKNQFDGLNRLRYLPEYLDGSRQIEYTEDKEE